jgi:membrane protease YdiL (CAAX protease family)
MPGLTDTNTRDVLALIGFFLLTFVITWTAWLAPEALVARGNILFGSGGPVFLLGVFAPALMALAFTAYGEGRVGIARLLARISRWRVNMRLYVFAIGYMAATELLAALIHRMVLGAWPTFGNTPLLVMLGAILISTWVQAGEEVGWRGYALPRLATHLGLGSASVLLGVIWALWHLPLFFLQGSGSEGQSFPIYLLHVTALSVAMSWLYWKTEGSLLLVMLMHASVNNTTGIVPAALPHSVDPMSFDGSLVAWATVGASFAIAALLLSRMRGAGIGAMLSSEPPRSRRDEPVMCE